MNRLLPIVALMCLLNGSFNILYGVESYDVDWEDDSEDFISDSLASAVRAVIASVSEVQVLCMPFLKGVYTYSHGDDLDVQVTLEHVRISNIIGVQLKTSYTRANDEIKCLLDVGSFTLVGDYKLEGLYYGEENKYHEATVVKYFHTVHAEFTLSTSINSDELHITGFSAHTFTAQLADITWYIDPDNGFNGLVSGIEEGFPNGGAVKLLNDVVPQHFGENGLCVYINEIFYELVKKREDAGQC